MAQSRSTDIGKLNTLLVREATRYNRAAVTAGAAFCRHNMEIGARLAGLGPPGPGLWRDLVLDLSGSAQSALEQFGLALGAGPVAAGDVRRVAGRNVRLPIEVRDGAQGLAVFAASLDAARSALASDRVPFEPVELDRHRTAAGVFLFDYRDSDLDSYLEIGAFCYVKPRHHPELPVGLYIRHLLVNQSFTQQAGREIWGLPKALETLELETRPDRVSCTFKRDGRKLLSLTVPGPGDGFSTAVPVVIYSLLDGQPQLSMLRLSNAAQRVGVAGGSVKLDLAAAEDHPACAFLRSLVLSEQPLAYSYSGQVTGSLSAPRPLV